MLTCSNGQKCTAMCDLPRCCACCPAAAAQPAMLPCRKRRACTDLDVGYCDLEDAHLVPLLASLPQVSHHAWHLWPLRADSAVSMPPCRRLRLVPLCHAAPLRQCRQQHPCNRSCSGGAGGRPCTHQPEVTQGSLPAIGVGGRAQAAAAGKPRMLCAASRNAAWKWQAARQACPHSGPSTSCSFQRWRRSTYHAANTMWTSPQCCWLPRRRPPCIPSCALWQGLLNSHALLSRNLGLICGLDWLSAGSAALTLLCSVYDLVAPFNPDGWREIRHLPGRRRLLQIHPWDLFLSL